MIAQDIIKEFFDHSDDEIVEDLMLDLHLQYALHTTSYVEQPISDKTLSRMELIYTCISKLVVYLAKKQPDMVPEPLKHYADPNDHNRIFYHQRKDDMDAIIQTLLADSDCLLELCKTDLEETTEYQLFVRCLSDQTVVENDKRRLRTREDGTMNPSALQNPSDPDATYRNRSGKSHRGYVANIEETVGRNGSVVTDHLFDKNTHTDSHFLQGSLSAMEKSEEEIILASLFSESGRRCCACYF